MFERYTEKARRVIFFARYEASETRNDAIGPVHLLLGVVRESGAQLLFKTNPALLAEAVGELRRSILGTTSHSTSIDLPLTDPAKAVLEAARQHADKLQHEHIKSAHLLFALLDQQTEPMTEFFQRIGLTAAEVAEKVSAVESSALSMGSQRLSKSRVTLPLSAEALRVLASSVEAAQAQERQAVDGADLLLGLADVPSQAQQVLAEAGLSPAELRQRFER